VQSDALSQSCAAEFNLNALHRPMESADGSRTFVVCAPECGNHTQQDVDSNKYALRQISSLSS